MADQNLLNDDDFFAKKMPDKDEDLVPSFNLIPRRLRLYNAFADTAALCGGVAYPN